MATAESTSGVPRRQDVPLTDRWDLESVFAPDEEWEQAFRAAEARLAEFAPFQGRLGESATTLLACLRLRDEILALVDRVSTYALLRRSEDATNTLYAGMADRGRGLSARARAACAFYDAEILAVDPERLAGFVAGEPGLSTYKHALDRLERRRPHTRSADVEELLAQVADLASAPGTIRSVLENGDLRFASIRDERDEEVALAQGNLAQYLHSPDRRVRREAWERSADAYLDFRNTFAATLAGGVKRAVFEARARRYPSALDAALAPQAIPTEVFHNLLDVVWRNLPVWHRYFRVRRRLLGLDELHGYDLTAPLIANEPTVPFDRGVELIANALSPLGAEYVGIVRRGIGERWVDAVANVGKGGGAFSWGTFRTKPFISMSYQGTLASVSTLAHELGHSLHSYLTWQSQPVTYATYSMFAAETASNMHQAFLGAALLAMSDERDWTISVIEERMGNLLRYLFTMPILARFELDCHQRIERGDALTADSLNSVLFDLYRQAYGGEVILDEPRMGITWARFSHLFTSFYVFQYATGIAAAAALAEQVRTEGEAAARRYITFLEAGGSAYPVDALLAAGVDMRSPEPIHRAYDILSGYVARLEAFADEA